MVVLVNWRRLVQLQVPMQLRRRRMIVWLLVLVSGIRTLHDAFLTYRRSSLYSLRITGQTIYLEKALNDRFDYINRGIWIETADPESGFFLHNRVEAAPAVYMYNLFRTAHPYQVGEFAVHAGRLWKALVPTPSMPPGMVSGEWSDEGPRLYLRNKAEGQTAQDFIVWVPVDLVYNNAELRALVAIYKLAGKRYVIMTY